MKKYQQNKSICVAVLSLTFMFVLINYVFAKDIHSTKEGGEWCKNSTWISGEIPGSNDNVTINGKVFVNCPAFADSMHINFDGLLIINETDSLQCHLIMLEEEGDKKGTIQNNGIIIVTDKPEIKKEEEY
ncbi:MAG: hypothetical protein V1779_17245 [bacterium]